MYGRWTVLSQATLRALPTARSASTGTIAANTAVLADSGEVRVSPIGLVVVSDTVPAQLLDRPIELAIGDTIELLGYEGEGYRNVRWRGRALTLSEYWDTLGTRGMRLVRPPRQRWWAHVTTGSARGWILMDSVRVRGADKCAGPV